MHSQSRWPKKDNRNKTSSSSTSSSTDIGIRGSSKFLVSCHDRSSTTNGLSNESLGETLLCSGHSQSRQLTTHNRNLRFTNSLSHKSRLTITNSLSHKSLCHSSQISGLRNLTTHFTISQFTNLTTHYHKPIKTDNSLSLQCTHHRIKTLARTKERRCEKRGFKRRCQEKVVSRERERDDKRKMSRKKVERQRRQDKDLLRSEGLKRKKC